MIYLIIGIVGTMPGAEVPWALVALFKALKEEYGIDPEVEIEEEVEETLHGMPGRIFQHENEHMNGYVFTDLVSKLKLERAEKTKAKMIKEIQKRQNTPRIIT
mgnify:CR=1 FL=1